MSAAGWKPEKDAVKKIIATTPTTDSGMVTYKEFEKLMIPIMSEQSDQQRYQISFSLYDIDNKGYITAADLARVAKELGEEDMSKREFDEMVKEAGGNKGRVTFEEFVKVMQFRED
jgi:calcium-binding protein CML